VADDLGRLVIRLNPLDGEPTHIVTILGKRPTHDDPIPLSEAQVVALRDTRQVNPEAPAVVRRQDQR